ncbi:hypothetical protein [Streptomyces sp. NPDC046197]|uniref:hypothetical protein n=1 Tax=Streptomyces sp. NPDC046197 TaxID=3154337 RepID=UPI0033C00552
MTASLGRRVAAEATAQSAGTALGPGAVAVVDGRPARTADDVVVPRGEPELASS